ncbi:uncharacterized protein LOC8258136 isoform X2 [Ricinus communis]|uniref:uncharacterized protein LOC8258136 isoform X2 n=1 Tax=Ricinus communis TaxID=3988 RepID=UPI000772C8D1|nr:uncharacterized protein LOC8258136 isoform X2 [Ricinus communis]|eukprot:XP_015582125.1 uncharacterized protein LOC8258136 isoform X2 [Ricinus communis]
MADSEKLTALKKAYADIILNSAKEAAARIMVSERKAQRYQRELFAAKDEALRMLLRLKQMLDSKVSEAEMASLNQQRRIEELEAQLGEAEDIVKDLRSELRELQDELEKVANSQMRPLEEQNPEGERTTLVTAFEENRLSTSGSVIPSGPASQSDPVITLETKNLTLNGTCAGTRLYSEGDCRKDNCFVCNPDFASIVMRSKEPELYRNGCTQRIRAFERSLLGGNLSLSGQDDDVKNQVFIIEDKEDKDIRKQLTAKVDRICDVEKIPGLVKGNSIRKKRRKNPSVSGQADGIKNQKSIREETKDKYIFTCLPVKADSCCHGGYIPRSLKRKRAARYRRHREYRSFLHEAVDNNVQTAEDSRKIDYISLKDPQPPVLPKSPSDTNEKVNQSGSFEVIGREAEFGRTCSFQNISNNDSFPIDELQLAGRDAGTAECSEFPASRNDFQIASVLPSNSHLKEPGTIVAVSPHPQPLFKYTFQRKRKKEFLSSSDGETSFGNHTLKKKMGEKQSGSLESDNSSLIAESSRDDRRLAQVARQLISLSEKQWK